MSIRSMTGFATASSPQGRVSVELKSVNHRFLDISIRLPFGSENLEGLITKEIKKYILRGKLDLFVKIAPAETKSVAVKFAEGEFIRAFSALDKSLSPVLSDATNRTNLITQTLLQRKELLAFDAEEASAPDQSEIISVVEAALKFLNQTREDEGSALGAVLLKFLVQLEKFVEATGPLSKQGVIRFKERVEERIKSAALSVSEERLAAEVALLADRTDVTEEIDRLRSHVSQLRSLISKGGEVGKKSDFFIQEMLREVNTIGSKSQSAQMAGEIVEAKATLEKMREQIQNIE